MHPETRDRLDINRDGASPTELERQVEAELSRLDPHLAGMFWHGVQIQGRVGSPGMAFVLGSITREVSNGVIRHFAGAAELGLSDEQIAELDSRNEGNRATIAAMLGLAADHPSVDRWFQFTRSLNKVAHYSAEGIDPNEALGAFDDLKKFMFTQLAGYFDTRGELDALLVTPSPTREGVESLVRLLSRPAQLRHFFSRLKHPAWAEPLLAAHFLPNVPGVPQTVAGEVRFPVWFEGEYLTGLGI